MESKQCDRTGDLGAEVPYDQNKVKEAFEIIKAAMEADTPENPGSYAHSWHCSIAMSCYDAMEANCVGPQDRARAAASDAATRFMKICFGVDTKA
jgi:hypothetical protein